MIDIIFEDIGLEEIYLYGKTKDNKYKKLCKDKALIENIVTTISAIGAMPSFKELSQMRNSPLHYEKLKHSLSGKSSVHILNEHRKEFKTLRLIFTENEDRITIAIIELSEHYGNIK